MERFFTGIFFIVAYIISSGYVYAAPTFSITPLVIDIEAEGRDIIKKDITVTNTGSQPATIFPSVNNISVKDGGGIEAFLAPVESDRTSSLASWLEISRQGLLIRPGEQVVIPLTLRVHPTPVPGSYHALIGFGQGDNRDEAERSVANGQAPGTIVNVTIADTRTEFLKLSGFIVKRFITDDAHSLAYYTFKNPSDQTLTPTGEIIVYDSTGKEVSSVNVNEEHIEIPAGGEHVFEAHIPSDGLFGKYKAFLSVEYGTTQRATVQDTSFFYVLPIKSILVALAILCVLVLLGSFYVHRKYFNVGEPEDSHQLMLHIREGTRDPLHHDIDLKKKDV